MNYQNSPSRTTERKSRETGLNFRILKRKKGNMKFNYSNPKTTSSILKDWSITDLPLHPLLNLNQLWPTKKLSNK